MELNMARRCARPASGITVALPRPAPVPDVAADLRNALDFVARCDARTRLREAETVRPLGTADRRGVRAPTSPGPRRPVQEVHVNTQPATARTPRRSPSQPAPDPADLAAAGRAAGLAWLDEGADLDTVAVVVDVTESGVPELLAELGHHGTGRVVLVVKRGRLSRALAAAGWSGLCSAVLRDRPAELEGNTPWLVSIAGVRCHGWWPAPKRTRRAA